MRSETIPPYRISSNPPNSQILVGTSSLQFSPLIFYRVLAWGLVWPLQMLDFVLSDPFLF